MFIPKFLRKKHTKKDKKDLKRQFAGQGIFQIPFL